MSRLGELLVRAAVGPADAQWPNGVKSSVRPTLGNLKSGTGGAQMAWGQGVANKGVASTAGVSYVSEGQPLRIDWNDEEFVTQAYMGHVFVMRCVRTIAETISGLPWVAGLDPTDPAEYNKSATLATMLGPATPQAPGGPNPQTSARAFWAWTVAQYVVTGRWGWENQLDGDEIIALWPLVSACLKPIPTAPGAQTWFQGYQYSPATGDVQLTPEQVTYCWKPSLMDWRLPESVLSSARLPIFIAKAVDKYMANLMRNDLVATTMVVTPPFEEPEMRRAWQDQFLSEFTGVDKFGATIFAEAEADEDDPVGKPLIQIERLAQTPVDAGLAQAALQAKIDITIAIGVPESLIGNASQRTYSNADSEYKNYWTLRVIPLLAEIQDHINLNLAPRLGMEVGWFDLSRVAAVQPPSIFAPPAITDVIETGVANAEQIANVLGIPAADATNDADIDTIEIGEESSNTSPTGKASDSSPLQYRYHPELQRRTRQLLQHPEGIRMIEEADRRRHFINTHTLEGRRSGKPLGREHITVRTPATIHKLVTSGPGFDEAERIKRQALELRAIATADAKASTVKSYLAENYPASTLTWVGSADWDGPQQVPLDSIAMARRPGGRDQTKVAGIAKALATDPDGPASAPVVLVKTPGSDKLKVADGYHRTVAHQRVGHTTVPAYVGTVDQDEGPWDSEMHDKKLNRSVVIDLKQRYDVSPLGAGHNWVTSVGGLPLFLRAIAHALIRNGHPESEAIQIAIGAAKRWAAGEGHVTPKTRAKAAETVAHWEAMKLAAKAS